MRRRTIGFYSWISAATGKSIIVDSEIVLVKPNNTIVQGMYDGYGCITDHDGTIILSIHNWLAKINDKSAVDEEEERINGTVIDSNSTSYKNIPHGIRYPLKVVRGSEWMNQEYNDLYVSCTCDLQGCMGSLDELNQCQW